MARAAYTDYLQSFPFWLMDAGPVEALTPSIFNPLLGFTSISAPDMTIQHYTINEGNWYFERHVVQRAAFSPMTLRRGVTFSDSDFYKWAMAGVSGGVQVRAGGPTFRRDFILIHFFARNPLQFLNKAIEEANESLQKVGGGGQGSISYGPFEFAIRIPAKAYLLKNCIPSSWRSGSDFDATDGSVSVAELGFACEIIEEISLAGSIAGQLGMSISTAASVAEVVGSIVG